MSVSVGLMCNGSGSWFLIQSMNSSQPLLMASCFFRCTKDAGCCLCGQRRCRGLVLLQFVTLRFTVADSICAASSRFNQFPNVLFFLVCICKLSMTYAVHTFLTLYSHGWGHPVFLKLHFLTNDTVLICFCYHPSLLSAVRHVKAI